MTPGLLVLSPDADMVEQICCRFSHRYDVRAATSPQKAGSEVDPSQVQAVLAHLGKGTLEGHSAEKFLAELQEAALQAPIFGLVEKDCPRQIPPIGGHRPAGDPLRSGRTSPNSNSCWPIRPGWVRR